MGEVAESLRETARGAAETRESRERQIARDEANERRRIQRAAGKYAREAFDRTVEIVRRDMDIEAQHGSSAYTKEWTAFNGEYNIPDSQELANYRALQKLVAGHFSTLDSELQVSLVDHRRMVRDNSISIVDGYSEECPPMKSIGQVIGVTISWAEADKA